MTNGMERSSIYLALARTSAPVRPSTVALKLVNTTFSHFVSLPFLNSVGALLSLRETTMLLPR